MTCARCGSEVPVTDGAEITCPRCGAPQPNPAWTLPFEAAGVPTLESKRSNQGELATGKKYAVVVVNGDEPGRVIDITKPRVVLGRADCDIVLKDPELSRQHALIAINGASARLEDLGSTNGTFMDDQRIHAHELGDRAEFRIGSHELVFVMRDEE